MGPLFRTNDAELGQREVEAIAKAETILAGEVNGSTAAALTRALNACRDASSFAKRESTTAALEKIVAELTQ